MKKTLSVVLLFITLFSKAQIFNIANYGAVGNGSTMNTQAIQAAVDSCYNAGGGIVLVPPGNFLTATIFLKSNVTVQIDSGATVTGSSSTSDYPDVIPLVRSYTDNYTQRSVFYAEGQHNIGIVGKGTFHGNGQSLGFLLDTDNKPYGFRFISCTNVHYEGVTLRHSGFWMMHNFDIDTLVIKNITLVNQNLGNGDGISIDGCRNVIVDSCFADCNDDAIVMKTTSPIACENVSISNCVVASYSRAIKMGTETHGAYRNIHVNNITVQLSTLGPFPNNPAKCGINLSAVDGGSLENVLIENVSMTGVKTPLLVRLGNRGRKYTPSAPTPSVGSVSNVELRNITAIATTNITSSITGIPNYYAKNIRLNNIDITFPGGQVAVYPGLIVPENIGGGPEANIFGDTLPAAGLYIRHVDSIQLYNVCLHPQQPDGRPTLVADDVLNLDSALVCITNSIGKERKEVELQIFPNPFSDIIRVVATGISKMEIADINGRVLLHSFVYGHQTDLDVAKLPTGVYLLKAYSVSGIITRKLNKLY